MPEEVFVPLVKLVVTNRCVLDEGSLNEEPVFVRFAPSPAKLVAVNVPFDELNVRLDPVFGGRLPVAAVTNVGKQVVSDDSSATVTLVAVDAVPVIAPAAAIAPAKNEVPPVTLSPLRAVTTPTESILVTSSYVSVPPIDTLPLNDPHVAFIAPKLVAVISPKVETPATLTLSRFV